MDVFASREHSRVPDGVPPWARLHILAFQSLTHSKTSSISYIA